MSLKTTKESAIALTKSNLFDVFGEPNATKRLSIIREIWAPSGECLFIEPGGVFKTHQSINDMITKLQEGISGQVFCELSAYDVLQPDMDTDTWVTRVEWGVGPPGEEPKLRGLDIVTIVAGKIKACYTFIGSQT